MDQIMEFLDVIIVLAGSVATILGLIVKLKGTSKVLDEVTDKLEKNEILEKAGEIENAAKTIKTQLSDIEKRMTPRERKILRKSAHKARIRWQDLKDDIEAKLALAKKKRKR
jgi:hypothetical protein